MKDKVAFLKTTKPFDLLPEEMLHEVAQHYEQIITVEDGTVVGGFGSAVLEFLNAHGYKNQVTILGIPDEIIEHAKPQEQYEQCGFDVKSIVQTALRVAQTFVSWFCPIIVCI